MIKDYLNKFANQKLEIKALYMNIRPVINRNLIDQIEDEDPDTQKLRARAQKSFENKDKYMNPEQIITFSMDNKSKVLKAGKIKITNIINTDCMDQQVSNSYNIKEVETNKAFFTKIKFQNKRPYMIRCILTKQDILTLLTVVPNDNINNNVLDDLYKEPLPEDDITISDLVVNIFGDD